MRLIVLALLAPTALASAVASMDVQIAGRHIDHFHYDSFYNAASGAYLVPSMDCDGAHRRIILSNSLDTILLNEGTPEIDPIARAPFNAQTGQGIRLGMTRMQVIDKLGIPSQSLYSKRFTADELIYQRYTEKDKRGWYGRYANFYLFRNNRLFYIEVSYDLIGGGCGWERGYY
jgi:hypothetical protein